MTNRIAKHLHLFDLWIFLLGVVAQVSEIVLQRLEELLSLFGSGCDTSDECHCW